MIIALLALAFAMIVGGLFAAILGWDIVLVERGWTMVLAGSISAASGALLLGVTAVVAKLSRIQSELMRLQANMVEDAMEEPAAASKAAGPSLGALGSGPLGGKASDRSPALEPAPKLPGFEGDRAAPREPRSEPEPGRREPGTVEEDTVSSARRPFEAVPLAAAGPGGPVPDDAPEVRVPDFLLAGRPRRMGHEEERGRESGPGPESWPYGPARDTGVRTAANDVEPLHAASDEEANVAAREPELRHAPGPKAEATPEPHAAPEEERPAESGPEHGQAGSIIGSYTSGDNKYVMYSDGSIEAETPDGMFRFGSLDELKRFIATGEGGTRLT